MRFRNTARRRSGLSRWNSGLGWWRRRKSGKEPKVSKRRTIPAERGLGAWTRSTRIERPLQSRPRFEKAVSLKEGRDPRSRPLGFRESVRRARDRVKVLEEKHTTKCARVSARLSRHPSKSRFGTHEHRRLSRWFRKEKGPQKGSRQRLEPGSREQQSSAPLPIHPDTHTDTPSLSLSLSLSRAHAEEKGGILLPPPVVVVVVGRHIYRWLQQRDVGQTRFSTTAFASSLRTLRLFRTCTAATTRPSSENLVRPTPPARTSSRKSS